MRNFLIVDIETMGSKDADICLAPFADKLKSRKKDSNPISEAREIKEKLDDIVNGKAALSAVCARLLSIGAYGVDYDDMNGEWGIVKPYFIHDINEANMLHAFNKLMRPQTEFVTFNGRNFDFRFLNFRYAVHSITPQKALATYPYNGRDSHHDLMLYLNEMGGLESLDSGFKYISLKKWIEYFGIKVVKPSIAKGEINLVKLLEQGNIDAIEEYNMGDVKATYEIFQRFVGVVNAPQYKNY